MNYCAIAPLSNDIKDELKSDFDRACAGSNYSKKTILSAAIDSALKDRDGKVQINLEIISEEKLEHYGEYYFGD